MAEQTFSDELAELTFELGNHCEDKDDYLKGVGAVLVHLSARIRDRSDRFWVLYGVAEMIAKVDALEEQDAIAEDLFQKATKERSNDKEGGQVSD